MNTPSSKDIIPIHDEDIPALTGLRAFAAIWVFILHACFGEVNQFGFFTVFDHKIDWGIFENFILQGSLAVSLFFILSGFIMAHVYRRHLGAALEPRAALIFYIKRLARIYPVHLFITLLLAGLFFSGMWEPMRPFDLEQVLLSVSLLNVFQDPSTNIPAWSVSAEWLAYLVCPLILFSIAKMKSGKFDLPIVLILCLAYPYIFREFFCCTGTSGGGAILRVMVDFVIGCLLYQMYINKVLVFEKKHLNDFACLFFFVLLFVAATFKGELEYTHIILPFILYYLAHSAGFMRAFFGSGIMVFLGMISYCIYMVHYPVLEFFTHFCSDFISALPEDYGQIKLWLFFGFMTAATLLAAAILYYIIERPCRRFIVSRIK